MGGRGVSQGGGSTSALSERLPGRKAFAATSLTDLHGGFTASVTRFEREGRTLEVAGEIRTAEGKFVGEFGSTFHTENGRLIAKTDNLLLEHAFQGQGVGAQMARNMEASYRQLGVSEVRLRAAQVGRYVWAKQGYEWSASTGHEMHEAFGRWLAKNGHDASEASIALRGAKALASSPRGKAFLLSDAPNWVGTKRLS